jgi:hypothetical protein
MRHEFCTPYDNPAPALLTLVAIIVTLTISNTSEARRD